MELSTGAVDSSGKSLNSLFPALVADAHGGVHAFWTIEPEADDESQDGVIFYSYWDGADWSAPNDILCLPRLAMRIPQVAIDAQDKIHLVAWAYGVSGTLWYSSALATEASSARGWQKLELLSYLPVTGAAVACRSDGRVYVVFCSGQDDDRVYFMQSDDGVAWSFPATVGEECNDCIPRLAVGAGGALHCVFGSQFTGGEVVYYSRSLDGGETWSPALEVDRVDERYPQLYENYGPTLANVLVTGSEVHIVWDGAPAGQRWHQWSADGGETWSEPIQISSDHRGLTLPVAMAVDSGGTLHLVSMGWRDIDGMPGGAYHFYWREGRWSEPLLITDRGGEYASLAVARGNVLIGAWAEKGNEEHRGRIWVSSLRTDAPEQAILPSPTATRLRPTVVATAIGPSPSPTKAGVAEPTGIPTRVGAAEATVPPPSNPGGSAAGAGLSATAIGILASGVVVGLAVARRLFHERRG